MKKPSKSKSPKSKSLGKKPSSAEAKQFGTDDPLTWTRDRWMAEILAEIEAEPDEAKRQELIERVRRIEFL